jgi:hypothetical protein
VSAPALNDYTRVREDQVLVEYAPPTGPGGTAGEYASVGCLEGDFSIDFGTAVIEDDITNWCTVAAEVEALASAQPGSSTITLSGTLVMLLGDEGYAQARDDAKNRVTGFWRITATDGNTPPNQQIDNFRGFFTQFNQQFRQDGVSVAPFTVRVVERLADES